MSSLTRGLVVPVLAGLLLVPNIVRGEGHEVSSKVAWLEEDALDRSLLYVIPALSGRPGRVIAELKCLSYSLYSSVAPSRDVAREENVFTTRLHLSLSLGERWSFWAEPQIRRLRWSLVPGGDVSKTALGDLWIGARLGPPRDESLIRLGLTGKMLIPSGDESADVRSGDFTNGVVDYALLGLCDLDLSRYITPDHCTIYLNAGYRWHRNETVTGHVWPDVFPAVPGGEKAAFNDALLLRLGWRYVAPAITLEAEIRADRFIHAQEEMGWRQNPVSAAASFGRTFRDRCWVRLGGEVALSTGLPEDARLPDPRQAFPDWVIFASTGTVLNPAEK